MSYVKQVAEENASGAIRRVYDAARARDGEVSELVQATSVDAKSTQAFQNLETNLMKGKVPLGENGPERRALVGIVVGNANVSYYCTHAYAKEYADETGNKKLAEQLTLDYRKAPLEDADMALCNYAVKLTLTPGDMTEEDLEKMRETGHNDDAIVAATQIVAYVNYTSRIANALGVEPEVWMMAEPEDWMKRRAKSFLKK